MLTLRFECVCLNVQVCPEQKERVVSLQGV